MGQGLVLLSLIIQLLTVILLLVLIAAAWYVWRSFRDIAQVTKRIEILTDVAGWLGFFQKLRAKK